MKDQAGRSSRVTIPARLVRMAERDFLSTFRKAMPGVRVTRSLLVELLVEEGMLAFTRDIVEGPGGRGSVRLFRPGRLELLRKYTAEGFRWRDARRRRA